LEEVLALKDMSFILRVNVQGVNGTILGYDLELSFLDTLKLKDMDKVIRCCSDMANTYFATKQTL